MARSAREKSSTGIYHIMLRGADRRIIFGDDEDCLRFLDTLLRVKQESEFQLYAYCLMGNHVHLLIQEGKESLERIFRRIGPAYVYYYNWKYQLHGHLFQDRYRSEKVEDDAYFLDVLRYICQNPVKAGLCKTPFDYPWLGCSGITVDSTLLDSLGRLTDLSREQLREFVNEPCDAEHLDDHGMKRLTDREAAQKVCEICECENVQQIGGWELQQRDTAIRKAMAQGISIRQFSRLTGISKAVIERIAKG